MCVIPFFSSKMALTVPTAAAGLRIFVSSTRHAQLIYLSQHILKVVREKTKMKTLQINAMIAHQNKSARSTFAGTRFW